MGIDRVEFSREGGVTGIPLQVSIESQSLSSEESEKLAELIKSSGFFSLPPMQVASTRGADRFSYEITLEADGQRHKVRTADPVPEPIKELVKFLGGLAKKHKRQSR